MTTHDVNVGGELSIEFDTKLQKFGEEANVVVKLNLSGSVVTFREPLPPIEPPDDGTLNVLYSNEMLDTVKASLDSNVMWADFNRSQGSTTYVASANYVASPPVIVNEATAARFRDDARAAFCCALHAYLTGSAAHLAKAQAIIGQFVAMSSIINLGSYQAGKLSVSWAMPCLARAGALVRELDPGWDPEPLGTWFKAKPMQGQMNPPNAGSSILGHTSGGNWYAVQALARMEIAAFCGDEDLMDAAVAYYRLILPAVIYLASDGARPVVPDGSGSQFNTNDKLARYWGYSSDSVATYTTGDGQEDNRDEAHQANSLMALTACCATAYLNGIDLFTESEPRLVPAATRSATRYNSAVTQAWSAYSGNVANLSNSSWLPDGWGQRGTWNLSTSSARVPTYTVGGGSADNVWEVARYWLCTVRENSIPILDTLCDRLAGLPPRTSTNCAGNAQVRQDLHLDPSALIYPPLT